MEYLTMDICVIAFMALEHRNPGSNSHTCEKIYLCSLNRKNKCFAAQRVGPVD